MKKIVFTLVLLAGFFRAEAKEAYGVLVENTLTIYYDDSRDDREGTTFDIYKDGMNTGWVASNVRQQITRVVFDKSVKDYRPVKLSYFISGFTSLTEIVHLDYLNTESVTTMAFIFSRCDKLKSIDVSHFDTSKVTNMRGMFLGCCSLESIDVSGFDTSQATSMEALFGECAALKEIDVSRFVTTNATDISRMFYGCSSLKSIDVSSFDTSKVTTLYSMFYNCSSLESVDVSHFDTSKVTSMGFTFSKCGSLQSLDLSTLDVSAVADMDYMFYGSDALKDVILPGKGLDAIGAKLFGHCYALRTIVIPATVKAIEDKTFADCSALEGITTKVATPFGISETTFCSDTYARATLYVPEGRKAAYQTAAGWKLFGKIAEGTPTGIEALEGEVCRKDRAYNINGQWTTASSRGIIIMNGKKRVAGR